MRTTRRATEPPAALAAFCAEHHPRVLGTLRLLTREDRLAEDLTQETFVRLCRDWDHVSRLDRPAAWLHQVAVHLAFSTFRRRRTERRPWDRVTATVVPPAHDAGPAPDERAAVLAALGTLDPRDRAVVVLRFFTDLSVRDTAHALGIPEGTVKTVTRRSLEALRSTGLIEEVTVHD